MKLIIIKKLKEFYIGLDKMIVMKSKQEFMIDHLIPYNLEKINKISSMILIKNQKKFIKIQKFRKDY